MKENQSLKIRHYLLQIIYFFSKINEQDVIEILGRLNKKAFSLRFFPTRQSLADDLVLVYLFYVTSDQLSSIFFLSRIER